jgi:hypothetical protein
MVERKKTGRAKARKGVSSVSSRTKGEANVAVHLGQALIGLRYRLPIMHIHISHHVLLTNTVTAQSTSLCPSSFLVPPRLRASSSASLSSSSFLSFASLISRLGFLKKAE